MGLISGIAQVRGASRQADAIEAGNEAQIALAREALDLYRPQIAAGDTARDIQLGEVGNGFENSEFYRAALDGFGVDREYIDSSTSKGNIFSGARLRALDDRARQRATGAYGQYYNALAGLSGAGQVATGGSANILQNQGANTANAFQQIGNAQANRAAGIGNAVNGAVQGAGNLIFGGF